MYVLKLLASLHRVYFLKDIHEVERIDKFCTGCVRFCGHTMLKKENPAKWSRSRFVTKMKSYCVDTFAKVNTVMSLILLFCFLFCLAVLFVAPSYPFALAYFLQSLS